MGHSPREDILFVSFGGNYVKKVSRKQRAVGSETTKMVKYIFNVTNFHSIFSFYLKNVDPFDLICQTPLILWSQNTIGRSVTSV